MFHSWIFDMDGLLAETESMWRIAEREAAAKLGIPITDADLDSTMGMRMRDVAEHWHRRFDWGATPTPDQVASTIVDRVVQLCADATPLPGVIQALDKADALGVQIGLCSSSDLRLIEAILKALKIADRFKVVHSAEHDEFGKPHPMPYLHTASKLGIDPKSCLVFEDSVAGCISAKAAGMTVVAVPAGHDLNDIRFGVADAVLTSMADVSDGVIERLQSGGLYPSLARPRFHLAFEVDSLDLARQFYGEILGCSEGRSADSWVDFDLFGHQVVAHKVAERSGGGSTNPVDGEDVPARHFGLLLTVEAWDRLVDRLRSHEVEFVIEPQTRFAGDVGEQRTCFLLDPSGNALEFKAFVDEGQVFAQS